MKRNINSYILAFEIAAIVILHAVKLGQIKQLPGNASLQGVSKTKTPAATVKPYQLLSIK